MELVGASVAMDVVDVDVNVFPLPEGDKMVAEEVSEGESIGDKEGEPVVTEGTGGVGGGVARHGAQ
jgi:hypothetical protein